MDLSDIQAVIDSAEARESGSLRRFVRGRLDEATEDQVDEATDLAIDIIETVPLLLAQALQEARERSLEVVVRPILDHAARYFVHPRDLIPEMTHGLVGLLDDAYLVLRILKNLQQGPQPLMEADLDHPIAFIRRLVGEDIGRQLDTMSIVAMREISANVNQVWQALSHEA